MQKDKKDLADRTKRFALAIIRLFSMLPKTTEAQVLGKQVLRSGTSVGANYRERIARAARLNLSRSPATRSVSSKRRVTGLTFSPKQIC